MGQWGVCVCERVRLAPEQTPQTQGAEMADIYFSLPGLDVPGPGVSRAGAFRGCSPWRADGHYHLVSLRGRSVP